MSITNCDEFYLKKYEKYIEIIVNKFIAKGNGRCLHIKDDLFQEAQLALLKWIKKQPLHIFDISKSFLDIHRALYTYVKHDTGIHIKAHKFSDFCNECRIIPIREEFDADIDFDTVDYVIDVERGKATLSPEHRKILDLKLRGFGCVEISKMFNTSKQSITQTVNSTIRNSYNAYFHPEQNPAPAQNRKSKSTAV